MLNAFFITARELAELLLCLEAIRAVLVQRHPTLLRPLPAGVLLGLLIALAVRLGISPSALDPRTVAAATLTYGLVMMWLSARMLFSREALQGAVQHSLSDWLDRHCQSWVIVAGTAFFTARETLELMAFLYGVQAAEGPSHGLVLSMLLGASVASVLALLYRRAEARSSLMAAFRISALLLALLSIELVVSSLEALASAEAGHTADGPLAQLAAQLTLHQHWTMWLSAGLIVLATRRMWRTWWLSAGTES